MDFNLMALEPGQNFNNYPTLAFSGSLPAIAIFMQDTVNGIC